MVNGSNASPAATMNDSHLIASTTSASLVWPIRFAVATWLAATVLVAVFALFWRMAYAPPHAFWAVTTTGTLLAAGGLTVISGMRSFFRRPRRASAAAVVVLGTTPIVWGAAYFATLYLQTTNREPLSLGTPTRIVAFWAESAADLEARWRYPRWTPGRHLLLLDDGKTSQPQPLVDAMDAHIEQMAATLGTQLPAGRLRWVRGRLLGQGGRALVSWAICDTKDNPPGLTSLDRHEVAHVVIMALGGVDQEPPMLLVEGWAESQSKDRADMIQALAWRRDDDRAYSLDELIGPNWYGLSKGPAYDHGGPFVIYLMEYYGPKKFLELYHGVRQTTFRADCERILGDSWAKVEEQFWAWLAAEAAALNKSAVQNDVDDAADRVVLAESVDPADWRAIVDGYRSAWSRRPAVPVEGAFALERTSTGGRDNSQAVVTNHDSTTQCLIDSDEARQLDVYPPRGITFCSVATKESSVTYRLGVDGVVVESDRRRGGDYVRSAVHDFWDQMTNAVDLGHYLPVDADRPFRLQMRINAIRLPLVGESQWEIEYSAKPPEEPAERQYKLRCDAAADWCVVSEENHTAKERNVSRHQLGTIFGRVTAIDTKRETKNAEGEWKVQLRLREMGDAESQQMRATVNDIVRRGAMRSWSKALARPISLAIAWPVVGLVLAGVGGLGGSKIKNEMQAV
jgi:hypothetical protein